MPFTCLNLPYLLLEKEKKDCKRRIVIEATLSVLYQISCANFPTSLLFTPPHLTFPQEYSLYERVASLGSILGLAVLGIDDLHLFKKEKYWFILLCWVLVATCRIFSFHCCLWDVFSCGMWIFNCGMWDLVPWPALQARKKTLTRNGIFWLIDLRLLTGSVESKPLDPQESPFPTPFKLPYFVLAL